MASIAGAVMAKIRSHVMGHQIRCRDPRTWVTPSADFPGVLAEHWLEKGAPGTQTGAHKECQPCRQQSSVPFHHTSPDIQYTDVIARDNYVV